MNDAAQALEKHLRDEIGQHLLGVDGIVHALIVALIGRGHVLLEGPPGIGKTQLSRTFAACIDGSFRRVQGTADLMPSDITGTQVYNTKTQEFEFRAGPIFTDVLLVDEINRAGPKTQSALLEAMEERQVSVDTTTHRLPDDFLVIATQNPAEFEGTFPLPESQLDRFMLSVEVSYPSPEDELRILEALSHETIDSTAEFPRQPVAADLVVKARQEVATIQMSKELLAYMMDIARATRDSARTSLGISTRGVLALANAARIEACLRGGDYAIPDDVQRVARWVIPHRLRLSSDAVIDGVSTTQVYSELLENVAVPL